MASAHLLQQLLTHGLSPGEAPASDTEQVRRPGLAGYLVEERTGRTKTQRGTWPPSLYTAQEFSRGREKELPMVLAPLLLTILHSGKNVPTNTLS